MPRSVMWPSGPWGLTMPPIRRHEARRRPGILSASGARRPGFVRRLGKACTMAQRARKPAKCPACPDCRLDVVGAAAGRRAGTARAGLAAVGRSHRQLGRDQGGLRGPAVAAAAAAGEHRTRPVQRHRRRRPLVAGALGHVFAAPARRVRHPGSRASHRVLRRVPRRHRHARPLPHVRPRRVQLRGRVRLVRRRDARGAAVTRVEQRRLRRPVGARSRMCSSTWATSTTTTSAGRPSRWSRWPACSDEGSIACCRRNGRRSSIAARRWPTSGTTTTTAPTTRTAARRPATPRGSTTPPTCRTIPLPLAPDADGPLRRSSTSAGSAS